MREVWVRVVFRGSNAVYLRDVAGRQFLDPAFSEQTSFRSFSAWPYSVKEIEAANFSASSNFPNCVKTKTCCTDMGRSSAFLSSSDMSSRALHKSFALFKHTSPCASSPRAMLPQAALNAVSNTSRSSRDGFFLCASSPCPDHSNCASTAPELIRMSYSSSLTFWLAKSRYTRAACAKFSERYAYSCQPRTFAVPQELQRTACARTCFIPRLLSSDAACATSTALVAFPVL